MRQAVRFANSRLVLPEAVLMDCDLLIVDGRVAAFGNLEGVDAEIVDVGGDFILPGLIDLHVNGAGGFDTMDCHVANALDSLSDVLLREGTIAFLPTTMSCTMAELSDVLATIAVKKSVIKGSEILGMHLEGPFISPKAIGAQAPEKVPRDDNKNELAAFAELLDEYSWLVRIVSFAPERLDGQNIAGLCSHHRIIASAAHTKINYEQMVVAINEWGVDNLTHSYNAMPGIVHREPGPLTAVLENSRVWMELIADGVHVHPAVMALTIKLKGYKKICLISDGTRAVGMPNGRYDLGGQDTIVLDGVVRLENGTIAGSAYPLLAGVRTLFKSGRLPLNEIVRMATLNPAKRMSVDYRIGSLEKGKEASLLRVDSDFNLQEVWRCGKKVN